MNQKLAVSLGALDNENDSSSHLFEICGIVFRAIRLAIDHFDRATFDKSKFELEFMKSCIQGEIKETEVVTGHLPFVEIEATRHVNLLSGDSYLNESRIINVQISEIENFSTHAVIILNS